jgi:hypothetical protein
MVEMMDAIMTTRTTNTLSTVDNGHGESPLYTSI